MQRRLITVILFALIAALASSTILYKVISANSRGTVAASGTTILTAARDLQPGAVVAAADVVAAPWSGAVAPQWIARREDIAGRTVAAGMNKGEPFTADRLSAKAADNITARIPPGMRAVAVHLDELSGLSRLIGSGMHVDILSTGSATQGSRSSGVSGMISRTILQNIEVLSPGQSSERNSKEPTAPVQSVNLLVTPEQAELLSLAIAENRIQLVLRNPLDTGHVDLPAVAAAGTHLALPARMSKVKPAANAPAPEKSVEQWKPVSPSVEVIHGTKKVVAQVSAAGNEESKQ